MKEDFLHYLWKFSLFSKDKLKTTANNSLEIISVGNHNTNTGPDFTNAKIRIGKQLWAGNIEIHLKSSDWYVHKHEKDSNYDAVILHIVYEDDAPVFDSNNVQIATLELKKCISKELLDNYQKLFSKNQKWLYCEHAITTVDTFVFENWLERLFFERLEEKALFIEKLLAQSANNWEAVLFHLLAKNFGLKINSDAFFSFATSINFSIVRKEHFDLENLEALFFGQAGLLNNTKEEPYYQLLQEKYAYLKTKYKLETSLQKIQFFRLRPANFPTIRISQLANLYHKQTSLFSKLMATNDLETIYNLLTVVTSSFWETHYTFDKVSKKRVKKTSKLGIDLLLINTIIPLQFVYQKSIGKLDVQQIITLQEQLKPEKNTIIEKFTSLGVKSKNAYETQALLQLKNNYCSKQQCLQCAVGSFLLKKTL